MKHIYVLIFGISALFVLHAMIITGHDASAANVKSGFMDNLHETKGVDCSGCHGKGTPKSDDTVENQRCLECHGPKEKLAKRSQPKDFPDRNPHKSHLGDIDCTVCHKGHQASTIYCLDCHRNFNMKIPGAAAR